MWKIHWDIKLSWYMIKFYLRVQIGKDILNVNTSIIHSDICKGPSKNNKKKLQMHGKNKDLNKVYIKS